MPYQQQLFILFLLVDLEGKPYKGTTAAKVPFTSTLDVDDFRKAVKAENPNNLASVDTACLKVYNNKAAFDGKEETLEEDSSLTGFGTSKKDALVVLVPPSAAPSLKPFHQKRYKTMSVDASCRKYLDAIASRLAEFHEFDYRHISGATIGDVLAAKDGLEEVHWDIRKAKGNHERIDYSGFIMKIRKGQPLTNIKLPDIYTTDEWAKISEFNSKTNQRVHNGHLPTLSDGRPYIVVPHSEFTPEMIAFLKNIGVKAALFSSPDVLEVKDEDVLSEGSSIIE